MCEYSTTHYTKELNTAFDLRAGHCRATCPLDVYPDSQVI